MQEVVVVFRVILAILALVPLAALAAVAAAAAHLNVQLRVVTVVVAAVLKFRQIYLAV
jgi:hypothetical protein